MTKLTGINDRYFRRSYQKETVGQWLEISRKEWMENTPYTDSDTFMVAIGVNGYIAMKDDKSILAEKKTQEEAIEAAKARYPDLCPIWLAPGRQQKREKARGD